MTTMNGQLAVEVLNQGPAQEIRENKQLLARDVACMQVGQAAIQVRRAGIEIYTDRF